MGADQFRSVVHDNDAGRAFNRVVDAAQWEYGHGGYTGTIAEKSGFTQFGKIDPAKAQDLLDALEEYRLDEIDADIRELADRARETYMDKWGPAACFDVTAEGATPQRWLFCGYASS